ncbi:PIF1-like helicase domain-containing protein [Ditylenchus destructor]|nr:PIF1-like helicase domain-containing protein [Ditylenchus destructor]
MGDGKLPLDDDGYVTIPENCMIENNMIDEKEKKVKKKAQKKAKDKKKEEDKENEKRNLLIDKIFGDLDKKKEKRNPLIDEIFGDFIRKQQYAKMSSRVILAPTNERVASINDEILQRLEQNESKKFEVLRKKMKIYLSTDEIDKNEPDNAVDYTPEFLHSCNKSGLPAHELKLMENWTTPLFTGWVSENFPSKVIWDEC